MMCLIINNSFFIIYTYAYEEGGLNGIMSGGT